MSIFGKKGGGLFGSLLGLALALPTGGASVAFTTLASYASIGFTLGNLLFPPEFDEEKEEYSEPEVREGGALPLIFGKHRTKGVITHFDISHIKSQKNGDFHKYYWGPMQIAVCLCENYPVNDPYGSLYFPGYTENGQLVGFQSASGDQMGINVFTDDWEPWEVVQYFPMQVGETFNSFVSDFKGDLTDLIEAIESFENNGIFQGESTSTNFTFDLIAKSWPQVSWGGNAIDQYAAFEDPDWAPNTFMPSNEQWSSQITKESFAGYWSEELPPLKNVLTLSSPVWFFGDNTSSAPSLWYEVWGVYPSEPGALYAEYLTNQLWGMGLDATDGINMLTFTGASSSFQLANLEDGLQINANVSKQSAKTLVEKFNYHLGTIIREDHLGRLELVAIRSLADGPTFTQMNYEDWIDAGSPDEGGTYSPGFPVVYDVYDAANVQISNQLWSTSKNDFLGKYTNAEDGYTNSSVRIKNNATRDLTAGVQSKEFTFDMFTDSASVTARLLQLSNEHARPSLIIRMELSAKFFGIRNGDGIRIWNGDSDLKGVYLRVASVEEAKIGVNEISIECTLDHASLYSDNLFSVDLLAPAQGKEPAIPDDPHDPLSLSAHPDFWNHNLAYDDASSLLTNTKKTHLYVAAGNAQQVAHNDLSIEGVLNPYVDTPIPQVGKGAQQFTDFGLKLSLLSPLYENDHSVSLDDAPVLVQLLGYTDQDISAMLATKSGDDWETDQTVLVISGRPGENPSLAASENVTEVLRFRTLEQVSDNIYRLRNVIRSANKEHARFWPIGSVVWVADLSEKIKADDLPYELFPNRSLAMPKADAGVDEGSHRVRLFTQSVSLVDGADDEEGTGFTQPEDEGLSITYDALNSSFFSGAEYIDAKLAPMTPCVAVRVGNVPKHQGLWFRHHTDHITNLHSSFAVVNGSLASNKLGLGYAPSVLELSEMYWVSAGAYAELNETVSAGLSNGAYSTVFQVSNNYGDSPTFEAKFSGNGANDASVTITWATGAVATTGVAVAYDMGNGTFRVFMSSTRTTGNNLTFFAFFHGASSTAKSAGFGEFLIYQGSTEALYTHNDWLVQFAPMGAALGGIGDKSIAPGGGGSGWGTFLDDDDEADIASNQTESQGTYKVFANYRDKTGLSGDFTVTTPTAVVASGEWPTLNVTNADMVAAGSSDSPTLATHFHPKQVEFRIAKLGSGGSYNVPSKATIKSNWSPYMMFKA